MSRRLHPGASRPLPTPAVIAALFLLIVVGFILGATLGLLKVGL